MGFLFKRHYTLAEARAMLPKIKRWLEQLGRSRAEFEKLDAEVGKLTAPGDDAGGETVNRCIKALAKITGLLQEFKQAEIQVKDLDRGLIDFPALKDGEEIFLCWEQDDDDIEYWHDLDTGYAGREKL